MSTFTRLAVAAILVFGTALPAAAETNSLTIATTDAPKSEVPDPRAAYNGWRSNQSGVTETLMGIDYDLNLYPRVAESIEQTDPTEWHVTLREGVTFHDGSSVTAQAVVDAILPISEEGNAGYNARTAKLLDLASVSADGDRVVVFETNSPNAAFPWSLSEPGVPVLGPTSDAFPINATGPYIFREAIPDQLYRVEANPDYRLGEPGFDEVRVVATGDRRLLRWLLRQAKSTWSSTTRRPISSALRRRARLASLHRRRAFISTR